MNFNNVTKIAILLLTGNLLCQFTSFAQLSEFKIGPKGDTINAINNDGQRVGKWVEEFASTRGEPGYVEEGFYKKGQKDSIWRRYTKEGDLLAFERFMNGGKAGLQQYYTFLGQLDHEESWKGYDPDHPYDTIPVYGTGSGEIIDYKVVKAEPYSVKEGEWRYYDPETGRLLKKEQWSNNNLVDPNAPKKVTLAPPPYIKKDKVPKTPEMLEWERKNRGKKYVDGRTGL